MGTAGGEMVGDWPRRAICSAMRDHKSLYAWQEAKVVARSVLRLSRTAWRPAAGALFEQLQRASLSVQLNIAEGYSVGGAKRFRYHLRVAYGSAVETADLLELAGEEGILTGPDLTETLEHCRRAQRLVLGLLRRPCAKTMK